jgi:hypothetical protein
MKAIKSKILIRLTALVMCTQAGLIYASSFVN